MEGAGGGVTLLEFMPGGGVWVYCTLPSASTHLYAAKVGALSNKASGNKYAVFIIIPSLSTLGKSAVADLNSKISTKVGVTQLKH
jgi:hypothetical protein